MKILLLVASLAQAGTLADWRFFEASDGVYAAKAAEYDAVDPSAGDAPFQSVTAYSFRLAPEPPEGPLLATARRHGALKIYRPHHGLRPHAIVPDAGGGGDVSAAPCAPESCRGLTLDRPSLRRAGTRLKTEDLSRPLVLDQDAGSSATPMRAPETAAASAGSLGIESIVVNARRVAERLDASARETKAAASPVGEPAAAARDSAEMPTLPATAAKALAQVRSIRRSMARHGAAHQPGDRFVVLDARGDVVAITPDAETAKLAAAPGQSVYRVAPAQAPRPERKPVPPPAPAAQISVAAPAPAPPAPVSAREATRLVQESRREASAAGRSATNAGNATRRARHELTLAEAPTTLPRRRGGAMDASVDQELARRRRALAEAEEAERLALEAKRAANRRAIEANLELHRAQAREARPVEAVR